MRLSDCFTIDFKTRENRTPSLSEIFGNMLFCPGFRVVVNYRISKSLFEVTIPKRLSRLLAQLILVRLSRIPGVEIEPRAEIGSGFVIQHPHDIVIGAGSKIEDNVTLYNGVTIGAKTLSTLDKDKDVLNRYPTIKKDVTIFAGAKIIGTVTIGQNSIVGANSVVTKSFPANSIIAGIPAELIQVRQ
jgi:serine O-acetyltransferase